MTPARHRFRGEAIAPPEESSVRASERSPGDLLRRVFAFFLLDFSELFPYEQAMAVGCFSPNSPWIVDSALGVFFFLCTSLRAGVALGIVLHADQWWEGVAMWKLQRNVFYTSFRLHVPC